MQAILIVKNINSNSSSIKWLNSYCFIKNNSALKKKITFYRKTKKKKKKEKRKSKLPLKNKMNRIR